jgi:hypothetical protein
VILDPFSVKQHLRMPTILDPETKATITETTSKKSKVKKPLVLGLAVILILVGGSLAVPQSPAYAPKVLATVQAKFSQSTSSAANFQFSPEIQQQIDKTQQDTIARSEKNISDAQNKHKVKLIPASDSLSNTVILNDQKILENVESLDFDTSGNYLYYTKFQVQEVTIDPNLPAEFARQKDRFYYGKIYRYHLAERKEEEVQYFKGGDFIKVKANQKVVVYILPTNEVGILYLDTKQSDGTYKTQIVTAIEKGNPFSLSDITAIDNEFVFINPADKRNVVNKENHFLKINLTTLEMSDVK